MLGLLMACSGGESGPPSWERASPGDRIEYRVTLESEDSSGGWAKLKVERTELAAAARVVALEGDIAWVELSVTEVNGEPLAYAPVAKPLLLPMENTRWEQAEIVPKATHTLAGRELNVQVDRNDQRLQNGQLTERWTAPLAEALYLCDGVVRTLSESPRRDGVVSRRVVELIDLAWGGGARMNAELPRLFEPGSWSLWLRKEQERELRVTRRYTASAGGLMTQREVRALVDHTDRGCVTEGDDEQKWCLTDDESSTTMRLVDLLDELVELALAGDWAPEGLPDSVPSKQGYLPVKVQITEGVMSVEGRPLEFTATRALALDPLDLDGLPWPERFAPLKQTRSFPHPWQDRGSNEQVLDWGVE